jgi:hypothetical protein
MWVTISFIWVSLDCTWLLLALFGLLVVAAVNVIAGSGVLFVLVGHMHTYNWNYYKVNVRDSSFLYKFKSN